MSLWLLSEVGLTYLNKSTDANETLSQLDSISTEIELDQSLNAKEFKYQASLALKKTPRVFGVEILHKCLVSFWCAKEIWLGLIIL